MHKQNSILNLRLIFLLAFACGSAVANLYYAQTIITPISNEIHLNSQLSSLIVTFTQVGYCVGLLFLVPLADIIENKRLILSLFSILGIFTLILNFIHTTIIFLLCCLGIGLSAVAVQIIIPFVAHFVSEETRGASIGNVTSGLLFGIMFARPLASFITRLINWHAVFYFSAALVLFLVLILFIFLPQRFPQQKLSYTELIKSLGGIFSTYPILRRRAIYHAVLFGVFSLYWTAIALLLIKSYHYSQAGVGLFAFVGAIGAFTAPIAGRLADRGYTKIATATAILLVAIACIMTWSNHSRPSITILILSALILDAGVAGNLVLGQRAIYALNANIRSRLNGLYMATFFSGGAIGSALASYLYTSGGWNYIVYGGTFAPLMVFCYFLSENK